MAASVAALLGLGVGVAGTLVLTDREDTPTKVEAMIRLEPLTGRVGGGTADLVQSSAGNQLKVDASGLDATSGFYQVWLINADGKRMVSLGILNPRTGGTFQIPAGLTSQGYQIVDVSLEPRDGNPEHSHDSIIRGTLPS
ncbi:anti-sigma factor [Kribbella sp. NPDC050470]|uniref:anti-sigma factor n=1 Tax=unclassified Kribbella TaxID=2644121 RepID=UPI003792D8DC